jgi:protein-disulfide isomerase
MNSLRNRTMFAGIMSVMFGIGMFSLLPTIANAQGTAPAEHLARFSSPTMGPADAKVHIVEFLDPACETCAAFYPHVKKMMADNPGRIRLSIRHVPLHQGSEHVVRILEAARGQDKYWETLEAVFANQDRWTVNHRVYPERVWPALEGIGLDLERARRDMNAADIAARIEKDTADARALNVTKTPEYFVNGRPMPRFGLEELQGLVTEELRSAYR